MVGAKRAFPFPLDLVRRLYRGTIGIVCSAAITVAPVLAADINVDQAGDSGVGSLRQGLYGLQPGDTLVFQPSLNGAMLVNNGTPLVPYYATTLLDANGIRVIDNHNWTLGTQLTTNWAGTLMLNGVLSDGPTSGSLVNNGSGTLVLTGLNTYSGGTTLESGTIQIASSTALGSGTLTVTPTVGTPTLALSNGLNVANAISSSSVLNIVSNAGTINQLSGVISDSGSGFGKSSSGSLNLIGGGSLILSGTNTFSGGVTVAQPTTVDLQNSAALGTGTLSNSAPMTLELISGLTVTNSVTMGAPMTVYVAPGSSAMTGNITETVSSQFTKLGSGTLILDGTNTYTGGTVIRQGVLEGSTSSLQGNITNNASLIFDQSGVGTFAGNIQGTGSMTQTGTGTLIFSGTSTLPKTSNVQTGELQVTGSITGPVNVNGANALLSGTGSVGSVTNNGYVQPGTSSSIGTLNVKGTFTQNSGGITEIKANSAGNTPGVNNDLLNVTGPANLGGTLHVLGVGAGPFSPTTEYTLLNASSVKGEFTQASSYIPGFGVDVNYNPTDVTFHLQPVTSFREAAITGNQAAVGTAMDGITFSSTGPLYDMINGLGIQSAAQQRQAMNQLSGDIYGNLQTIALQVGDQYQQQVTRALVSNGEFLLGDHTGLLGGNDPEQTGRGRGWIQSFGSGGNIHSDGNASGANYSQGGALIGMDFGADETTRVGIAGGSSYVGFQDGSNSQGQMMSYQIGGYALERNELGYTLMTGNYGYNSYWTRRNVDTGGLSQVMHGNFAGNQAGANVETGLFVPVGFLNVQPLIGLQYLYLCQQSFDESGGGPAALNVSAATANALRANVGARVLTDPWVAKNGVVWIPFSQARFVSDLLDNDRNFTAIFNGAPTGGAFVSHGARIGPYYGLVGQGLEIRLTQLCSLYGGADVMTGDRFIAVSGSFAAMARW